MIMSIFTRELFPGVHNIPWHDMNTIMIAIIVPMMLICVARIDGQIRHHSSFWMTVVPMLIIIILVFYYYIDT